MTFPIRVLAALGVTDLLLTNAAGGIRSTFRPGDFMVLSDHINFLGENPLRGALSPGLPRFVDLSRTYDPELRRHLIRLPEARVPAATRASTSRLADPASKPRRKFVPLPPWVRMRWA